MPTYDYACPDCGGFDALRNLSERNDPALCPDCGAASPRVFVSAPRLACLSRDTRTAMDANERAKHAPMNAQEYSAYKRLKHPSGCGCCASSSPGQRGTRGATVTSANGSKMFPGKRPWMISH